MEVFDRYESLVEEFACLGYVVIPNFLKQSILEALRAECDVLSGDCNGRKEGKISSSCVLEPMANFNASSSLVRSQRRLYLRERARVAFSSATISSFVFGSNDFKDILSAILGPEIYLLNEQYIIKPPGMGIASSFPWHRDADSMRREGTLNFYPYVSVWCALDAVDERNGGLCMLPVGQTPAQLKNTDRDRKTILKMDAGDAVIISHDVWHCSTSNSTPSVRRAYMPQFSAGPICYSNSRGSDPSQEGAATVNSQVAFAVPLNADMKP
jgi:ectoine hydroxylase-related dioxygenase (phytanoyl-CoA dioxygenase family)